MNEPYFDIVEIEMDRDDVWADLARLFGIRLKRKVTQMVWREGGRERMERDYRDNAALLTAHLRGLPY